MQSRENLSRAERCEIKILLAKRYSLRSIAQALSRSPNTVSYEIRQNRTLGVYDPLKAQAKARLRKRMRKLNWSKIEQTPSLERLVIAKLARHWNPDEIAGWLKRTSGPYVSKTAIYEWLRTARGERYCVHLYSQRKRVKKRKPKTKRVLIPNRVDIAHRFAGANNRTRYGHSEVDAIVGRRGTPGGLKTAVERKSRLVAARKVASMRPAEHAAVETQLFRPLALKSLTRDNGIENRDHEQVPIPSFFCRPYASWQKGSVEHANKMLRRYFPRGTDFRTVSQVEVDRAVLLINEKPRKILGYRCALEVARAGGIIKSESVLTLG